MGQFSFPCQYTYSGHLLCALVHVAEQSLVWKMCLIKMDKEKKKRGAEKLREKQKMETDAAKCETLIVRAAAVTSSTTNTYNKPWRFHVG